MRISRFVVAVSLLAAVTTTSQAQNREWEQTLPGATSNGGAAQASDGSVVVAYNQRGGASLVKLSGTDGAVAWTESISKGLRTTLSAPVLDRNGDIYITAYVYLSRWTSSRGTEYDYATYLYKFAGTGGSPIWEKEFNAVDAAGNSSTDSYRIAHVNVNSEVFVHGSTRAHKLATPQRTLVKLDAQGNQLFVRPLGRDEPTVAFDANDDYWIATQRGVKKYSAAGALLWSAAAAPSPAGLRVRYTGPTLLRLDTQGNGYRVVQLTGTDSSNAWNTVFVAQRLAVNTGVATYTTTLDPVAGTSRRWSQDRLIDAAVGRRGNLFITARSTTTTNTDCHVYKLGTTGSIAFERSYDGGATYDHPLTIALGPRNVYVGGYSTAPGSTTGFLLAYSRARGTVQSLRLLQNASPSRVQNVIPRPNGTVVAGLARGAGIVARWRRP